MMKVRTWAKRVAFSILTFAILLLAAGFIFESISRNRAEKIIPNGGFADVGQHRLHYLKKGTGGPTVVFESGLDPTGHLQWYNLQQSLAGLCTTVSYDRAGILWSERGANPKSGEKIAEELHRLLEQAGAPKPYILVGHSLGGMLCRFFVHQYPQEVAAVILIDSQHPDNQQYLSPELYKIVNQGLPAGFLQFANTFGLARLMFRQMFPAGGPYAYQRTIMPALLYKSAAGVLEEQDETASVKAAAARIRSFGAIPLCVISAADESRFDNFIKDPRLKAEMLAAWRRMQENLLQLSSASRQVVVPNSGHYMQQDQPAVVEEVIQTMVRDVRKGLPGSP